MPSVSDSAISNLYKSFSGFIDTIKSYDDSIYFWIQGGALRRSIDGSLEFKSSETWYWDKDVDIHVPDEENYNKFVDIITNKMGFRQAKEYHWNVYYSMLGFYSSRGSL